MRRLVFGLALSALAGPALHAQHTAPAFGFPMGASVASLEASGIRVDTTGARFVFIADSVPAPDAGLMTYYVTITPRAGLCKVLGNGDVYDSDSTGARLRSALEATRTALEARYGVGERIDYLQDGSHLAAPGQWMMSVKAGDRAFGEIWPADSDATLSPGVQSLLLRVNAVSADAGYLSLSYEGSNFPSCLAELRAPSNPGP